MIAVTATARHSVLLPVAVFERSYNPHLYATRSAMLTAGRNADRVLCSALLQEPPRRLTADCDFPLPTWVGKGEILDEQNKAITTLHRDVYPGSG
jgi:hypothetical protein